MALKAFYDNEDDVPAEVADHYKEVGGKFVLQVDGIKEHPETVALSNTVKALRTEKKDLGDKLKAAESRASILPEDMDEQKFNDLLARAEGNDPAKVDERLQRQREADQRKYDKDIAEKDQRIQKMDGKLRRTLIDEGLTQSLVDAGVDKSYLPAAKALLKEKGKIKLVEEDDDFIVVADDGINERADLSAFVGAWAQSDAGKPFIAKATGSGAEGSGNTAPTGDNPWSEANGAKPNLTKQNALILANPEKARRLCLAAGKQPNW